MNVTVPVTVRHVSKNVVTIVTAAGYRVTLFNLSDGKVEAVVSADDGSETIRLLVAGPSPSQTMAIKTDKATGVITISYGEKPRD